MPLMDAIFARRSIREFRADPVPEEILRDLIAAAVAAPSAHNAQPWRFVVLRDGEARRALAERMAEAYRRDAEAEGRPAEEIRERNDRSIRRIAGAPAAVLFLADFGAAPPANGLRAEAEKLLQVQSVAAAVENLLLAAHAEGLGGCWIGAPIFCPQAVQAELDLPPGWVAQALVLLGYPAEAPARPESRPLSELILWR